MGREDTPLLGTNDLPGTLAPFYDFCLHNQLTGPAGLFLPTTLQHDTLGRSLNFQALLMGLIST